MAREVIVKTWCDVCLAADGHTEAEELPALNLLGGNAKARVIALCEVHRKELVEPLVQVLADYGQPVNADGSTKVKTPKTLPAVAGGGAKVEGHKCPSCDHTSPNRAALTSHVRGVHHESLAQLEGTPAEHVCPECGKAFARSQGLGVHMSKIHHVPGPNAKPAAKAG